MWAGWGLLRLNRDTHWKQGLGKPLASGFSKAENYQLEFQIMRWGGLLGGDG